MEALQILAGFIGLGLFFFLFFTGMTISEKITDGKSIKEIITGKK